MSSAKAPVPQHTSYCTAVNLGPALPQAHTTCPDIYSLLYLQAAAESDPELDDDDEDGMQRTAALSLRAHPRKVSCNPAHA